MKFLSSSSALSVLSRARYRACDSAENIEVFTSEAFDRRKIVNNFNCSGLYIQNRAIGAGLNSTMPTQVVRRGKLDPGSDAVNSEKIALV